MLFAVLYSRREMDRQARSVIFTDSRRVLSSVPPALIWQPLVLRRTGLGSIKGLLHTR